MALQEQPTDVLDPEPYRLWIEFLKQSDRYKQFCFDPSQEDPQLQAVYDGFGDVFSISFDRWWKDHESSFAPDCQVTSKPFVLDLTPTKVKGKRVGVSRIFNGDEEDYVFLAIDLYTPPGDMAKAIDLLVSERQKAFLGYRSKAEISKRKPPYIEFKLEGDVKSDDAEALERTLATWKAYLELRRTHSGEALWEALAPHVARRIRKPGTSDSPAPETNRKKSLVELARQTVDQGKALIHFVEHGRFPIREPGVLWMSLFLPHGTLIRSKGGSNHAVVEGYQVNYWDRMYSAIDDALTQTMNGIPATQAWRTFEVCRPRDSGFWRTPFQLGNRF